jgi:phosphatidylglycerol:prolipoprotein diacylglycerol transferase
MKIALDAALIVMVAALVGARLFHVLYENPEIYRANPWAVFYLWNGGFVFYGGALLAAVCGFAFVHWKVPREQLNYLDLFAPVASLAYALGRWGCFFAGCCYGRYCDLPWAVNGRHPTQLYASFWEIGTVLILLGFEKKSPARGRVFFLWLILHAIGRILMESFRDDFRGPNFLFSVSTWISLGVLAFGVFFFIAKKPETSH